jgi:hypothetical protein
MKTMIDQHLDRYPIGNHNANRQYRLVKRATRQKGAFASNVYFSIESIDENGKTAWSKAAFSCEETGWIWAITPQNAILLFVGKFPEVANTYTVLTPYKITA